MQAYDFIMFLFVFTKDCKRCLIFFSSLFIVSYVLTKQKAPQDETITLLWLEA